MGVPPLMAKRVHETNMFLNVSEIMRATRLIEELHHTHVDWGKIHRWLAERYLRNGDRAAALVQLAKAAAKGELGGVAEDLSRLLRRRLRRLAAVDRTRQRRSATRGLLRRQHGATRVADDLLAAQLRDSRLARELVCHGSNGHRTDAQSQPLLAMTLRSVLRQQHVDLEVVVVDEASTDDTHAVIAAFDDCRVRVIHHARPVGVSAARNRGAAEARGEWLSFLDDDDLWAPDKLVWQLRAAREANVDWAYSGAVVIDHHERFVRAEYPVPAASVCPALLRYYAIPGGSNILVRRSSWQQVGPFDPRMSTTEDWDMCIRLAKHSEAACVCRPSVARRIHSTNSTLDISEVVRGTKLLEATHETRVDWGKLHRWMAHSCLRAGRPKAALGQFARAALHGQIVAVASDLSAILRERIAVRFAARRDKSTDDPWRVAASQWIAELRSEAALDAAPENR